MFQKRLKVKIQIEGMHCEHCAKKIEMALKKIEKVSKVKVDVKRKEATVFLKTAVDHQCLIDAIESLDYKVLAISE